MCGGMRRRLRSSVTSTGAVSPGTASSCHGVARSCQTTRSPRPLGKSAKLETAIGAGSREIRRIEHEDVADHRMMHVAVHAHVARVTERDRLLLAGAIETDVERVVLRRRERVVQDRILIRKPDLAPDHDRQDARHELLALRAHRVGRRRRLAPRSARSVGNRRRPRPLPRAAAACRRR